MKFSSKQLQHITNGANIRQRLLAVCKKAANAVGKFRHTYVFGPAGIGKTHSVEEALEAVVKAAVGLSWHTVSGNVSMFAFGVQLAVIDYLDTTSKWIVINIDDCDEILKNETNCNIMKNVLSGSETYSYEKSLQSQLKNMSDIQRDAIEAHSSGDKMGFEVPCGRFIFIFTSNFKLPSDDDVKDARERGVNKAVLMAHRNAIRSRCQTNDFDLDKDQQWGWIADVVLNTPCLNNVLSTRLEKELLLDWMFNNWDDMVERSIRTAEKMAEIMVADPTGYRDSWEIDFLKF
jgi:hypothetical protein